MNNRRKAGPARLAVLLIGLSVFACRRVPESRPAPATTTPTAATKTDASGRKVLYWYDPMAPGSKFDRPGKSPFMDMELVPKYADEETAGGNAPSAAAVRLSPEAIRATGIATVSVTRGSVSNEIRAVGTIEIDETRQVRVSARVGGRLEKLFADFTGQRVEKGAPLYEIYSPDLVATEREYLLALENRRRLAEASADDVRGADDLVAAARERLHLWGIGPGQVAELERTGQPELRLLYRSPIAGTVLQKMAVEGQYVAEGTELYLLADLSSVWLVARVYEHELGGLRAGQPVEATVSALPGRSFRGRIAFIDPVLDRDTRSARVRIALPNPSGSLKPGMYADARLEFPTAAALVIPRSALIDTGARRIVYVEVEPNVFRARDVVAGTRSGDSVAVLSGLKEGERVVAAANFFVDSQAQLSSGSSIQWSGALDVREPTAEPSKETTP